MSKIRNIVLRPHHLLCTQTYDGKGYNADFVRNMTLITGRLRSESGIAVDIVFSADDLCAKCPNMQEADLCKDSAKVKRYDEKVANYFGIQQKSYIYREIVAEINVKMTAQMLEDICSDCAWYSVSGCRERLLQKVTVS